MDELYKTPAEELIEALSDVSDEAQIYNDWFIKRVSIADTFLEIFDVPHINWDIIAPNSKQSRSYTELFNLMNEIYGDKYRRSEFNGHICTDSVELGSEWRKIPKLARTLKDSVERELAERNHLKVKD